MPENLEPLTKNAVLIVDDEATIRSLFSTILSFELPEATTETAANGLEGVKSFEKHRPSVILMDLKMPEMDGHQAFLAIRKMCAEKHWVMPGVVFCTGFSPPEAVGDIVEQNPLHHLLLKPVTSDVIVEAIRERL